MRGYHESCEKYLFHFGLHVSVLPEGHLDKNIMKIEDDEDEEDEEDDDNCDGDFDEDCHGDEVEVDDDDGTLAGSHLHRGSSASLLQGRPGGFHRQLNHYHTLDTQKRETQATFLCKTKSWFDLKETCTFSSLEHRLNSRSATAKARRADSVKMINLRMMLRINMLNQHC